MSSIGTLTGSQYYQLSNPSAGPGGSAATPTLAGTLAQALSPSPAPSAFGSDAFLLDLSPQAQQLLNGGGSSNSSDIFGGSTSFTLTAQQQQQIAAILTKYKDAPYTQDTFNQIQNDLNAAGLGPDQLSLQDKIKSFDPTTVLLDALNGTATDTTSFGGATTTDEQTKSGNYMQQIVKQWQAMSSTYASSGAIAPVAGA